MGPANMNGSHQQLHDVSMAYYVDINFDLLVRVVSTQFLQLYSYSFPSGN